MVHLARDCTCLQAGTSTKYAFELRHLCQFQNHCGALLWSSTKYQAPSTALSITSQELIITIIHCKMSAETIKPLTLHAHSTGPNPYKVAVLLEALGTCGEEPEGDVSSYLSDI